jgi:hypothetical protein
MKKKSQTGDATIVRAAEQGTRDRGPGVAKRNAGTKLTDQQKNLHREAARYL